MSQYRLNLFIQHEHAKRLEELAAPAADLALFDDDDDLPLPLPRQLDPAMQSVARLASLDPSDGIEL